MAQVKCGESAARGEGTGYARSRGREKNPGPQAPAQSQGLSHSPSPVPDLRHQLLVTFAQGRLLVCAHQASALQEELGQWRARGRGEPAQKRRAAWHWLERAGWRSKSRGGWHTVAPEPEMAADDRSRGDMGLPKFTCWQLQKVTVLGHR